MNGTEASGMPAGTKRPRYAATRQKTCHHCSAAKAKCDRGEGGCARCASRGLVCAYPSPQARQQQSFVDIAAAATADAGPVTAATAHDGRVGNGGGSDGGGGSNYGLEVLSGLAVSGGWISPSSSARRQPVQVPPRAMTTAAAADEPDQLDLRSCSALLSEELACPVNAEDVRNRWLHPYVPMPGQEAKAYPRNVTAFICRVLSSYAGVVRRGRFRRGGGGGGGGRGVVVVPPFIHPGQVCGRDDSGSGGGGDHLPLDTCLRLARALGDGVGEKEVGREDGEEGEEQEQEKGMRALREEMDGVYEWHREYDGVTMLSAFQAYLVYSLILFSQTYTSTSSLSSSSSSTTSSSSVSASSRALLRQAMMNLQDLASSSIRQGIVLLPRRHHHHQQPHHHHHHQHHRANQRPSWESWVVAETKRRALYTMYLFDSALSSLDDLPTFLGTELRGLPAPAGGSLWAAGSREAWRAAYNDVVADWGEEGEGEEREEGKEGEEGARYGVGDGGFLRIEELWPVPPGTTDAAAGMARRERRIGRWLENADEFGMMLYAVTCGTHGV